MMKVVRTITTKERILALKLLEMQKKDPEYVRQLGVWVELVKRNDADGKQRRR